MLHLLTDEQNRSLVLNAKKLLKMFLKYSKKKKKRFNNLATGYETWVCYFEPKRKCSNSKSYQNAIRPSIAKIQRKAKKVLDVIFLTTRVHSCNCVFQRAEPSRGIL